MSGKFPRPYHDSVPSDPDPMMVIVPMRKMGIGARSSGLPKTVSTGPGSIEHVGGSEGKKG
jgi:hypothetical protein